MSWRSKCLFSRLGVFSKVSSIVVDDDDRPQHHRRHHHHYQFHYLDQYLYSRPLTPTTTTATTMTSTTTTTTTTTGAFAKVLFDQIFSPSIDKLDLSHLLKTIQPGRRQYVKQISFYNTTAKKPTRFYTASMGRSGLSRQPWHVEDAGREPLTPLLLGLPPSL